MSKRKKSKIKNTILKGIFCFLLALIIFTMIIISGYLFGIISVRVGIGLIFLFSALDLFFVTILVLDDCPSSSDTWKTDAQIKAEILTAEDKD